MLHPICPLEDLAALREETDFCDALPEDQAHCMCSELIPI
jgi:predicted naringenin-chalcone synthase